MTQINLSNLLNSLFKDDSRYFYPAINTVTTLLEKIMRFFSSSFFLTALLLCFTNVLHAEEVAITMDDPNCGPPSFYTHEVRDQKILAALKKNHLKIVLFVHGMCVDNPEGIKLLRRWNSRAYT